MKSPRLTLALILLCLMFLCAGGTGTTAATEEGVQQAPEKEIFINIHSGIKTIPVRKVISVVIEKAEEKDVDTITGNGTRGQDGAWMLELAFIGEEKEVKRSFKWRYVRDEWELTPLNKEAKELSFPLSGLIFSTAINMGFGMIEGQGVSPKVMNGHANILQSGRWEFDLTGLSDNGERFVQKWSYDAEKGALYPAQFDHSDLDKLLKESVTNGKVDYAVIKDTPHLKRFLKKIAKIKKGELESFSREEQLAFWINAYNAIMLKVLADNYPDGSAESIAKTVGKKKFKVARKKLTLGQIRDNILRDTFKDDRVDFSLVSTSWDSPVPRAEAYCGRLLEYQLDEAARNFINKPHTGNETNKPYLSEVD